MNKKELRIIINKTRTLLRKLGLDKTLQDFPQSILVFRLALDMSQKEFLNNIENAISQVTLIKYEKGRIGRISKKIANSITNYLDNFEIKIVTQDIIKSYERYKSLQRGSLSTERARELQKKWLQTTTLDQRRKWGLLGVKKTLKRIKETPSETKVREILQELGFEFLRNKDILIDDDIVLNVDFWIELNNRKVMIEVTERRHNLTIVAQALVFRSIKVKEVIPNTITLTIVPEKMTLMGQKLLEKYYDHVVFLENLKSLKKIIWEIAQNN